MTLVPAAVSDAEDDFGLLVCSSKDDEDEEGVDEDEEDEEDEVDEDDRMRTLGGDAN